MAIVHLSDEATNAALDAVVDLLDSGYIEFYDGTMPATPDTAVATQTLGGTVTFGSPAFGAASAGSGGSTATANAITEDSSADNTITVSWARIYKSDASEIADVDVTATGGGGALTVASTTITAGQVIEVTSLTWTQPDGT